METINDGGPAFPINDHQFVHRVGAAAVEGITDSAERDRIYTEATARASAGMSLRDYFAAHAPAVPADFKAIMVPSLESGGRLTRAVKRPESETERIIRWRWHYADMVLRARGA
ncbi:hypothetical protein WJ92_02675 [Burkholderia ubonensis]|uniref:hypothetical protein n=1 Tax=Burkholderia ubonensis TaxID=101571 RepID=UPI00075742BF|nr:hypothetical protein [Burkholderia ubonensis]KVP77502.1 hypothetical protein WJ92_02675 [Burkholderia ubonensis]